MKTITKVNRTTLASIVLILVSGFAISSRTLAEGEPGDLYLPFAVNNYPIIETGTVVFVSNRDGNSEIYRMNHDGSELIRLTNNISDDGSPDWSPDGSKIAFQSNRSGEFEIYIMNADGTDQMQLTTMHRCYVPQWSPDGTRIAFYTRQDNNNTIYTMNPDGTGLEQVTDPDISAQDPYWSPDGLKIAFLTSRIPSGLYTINIDGTNPDLVIESAEIASMAWSPEGEYFALSKTSSEVSNFDIYTYEITPASLVRITTAHYNHLGVDWSPGGYSLIFYSNRDNIDNFEIYTMAASGDQIKNISNHPAYDIEPDWTR